MSLSKIEIPKELQKEIFRFIKVKPQSKQPIEKEWTEKSNYKYNNPELLEHIEKGGNYGILGGYGDLTIIDADCKEIEKAIEEHLPPTLKVRTGGGGIHYYYYCPDLKQPIRLTSKNAGDLGDVQSYGKQCVAPNCIHPNGKIYEIEAHEEIKEILAEQIRFALREFTEKPRLEFKASVEGKAVKDLTMGKVVDLANLKQHGEEYYGANPIHGSKGGMNFWVNPSKDVWHCFRCDSGGDALTWLAVKEGIINCSEAIPGALTGDKFKEALKKAKELVMVEDKPLESIKIKPVQEWPFENLFLEGHFITEFLDYGTSVTDAYPEYHFATAFCLLATATDRKIKINVNPEPFYTNTWFLLIGQSTVSRKSTSMTIGKRVLEIAGMESKELPEDFTPEALVEVLSEKPQSIYIKDEFGDFLAKMDRQYQSGVGALLSQIYDNPKHYERTLRKQKFIIEEAFMNFVGGTVPTQVAKYITMDDLESGFFPRMLFVWAEREKNRKKIDYYKQEDEDRLFALGMHLKKVHNFSNFLAENKLEVAFIPDKKGLEIYNQWCEDFEKFIITSETGKDFAPFFGRAAVYALKLAALIELGDKRAIKCFEEVKAIIYNKVYNINNSSKSSSSSSSSIVVSNFSPEIALLTTILPSYTSSSENKILFLISKRAVQLAIFYVSRLFLPNARKILLHIQANEQENQITRVLSLLKKHIKGDKMSHTLLLKYSNLKAKEFEECIETLAESGRIIVTKGIEGGRFYSLTEDIEKMPEFRMEEGS